MILDLASEMIRCRLRARPHLRGGRHGVMQVSVKQTQFRPDKWVSRGRVRKTKPVSSSLGPAARKASEEVGRGRPTYEEADCAKQSQFRPSDAKDTYLLGREL